MFSRLFASEGRPFEPWHLPVERSETLMNPWILAAILAAPLVGAVVVARRLDARHLQRLVARARSSRPSPSGSV